jgi:methylmalonyl-CoA/ethylmalonyl-CoA epimerase
MKLLQVAQHADDLDRAAAFYTELLQSEPIARFDPPGFVFFSLAGVRLLLERGAPSSLLYLDVPDLDATLDRLRDIALVESEPREIYRHEDDSLGAAGTVEWHAVVRDSEGNFVTLVSQRPGE